METSLENLYMYVAARQKLTTKAYSVSKDVPSSLIDIRDYIYYSIPSAIVLSLH